MAMVIELLISKDGPTLSLLEGLKVGNHAFERISWMVANFQCISDLALFEAVAHHLNVE
jgi:hypothetical protein